jgi:hypothetical protein
MNNGLIVRPRIAWRTLSRVTIGCGAPVAETTISAAAKARSTSVHGMT